MLTAFGLGEISRFFGLAVTGFSDGYRIAVCGALGEGQMDFGTTPLLVVWEVTKACDLACVHCRASARPGLDPEELSTGEGMQLLEEIRRFGNPLVVLSGGSVEETGSL